MTRDPHSPAPAAHPDPPGTQDAQHTRTTQSMQSTQSTPEPAPTARPALFSLRTAVILFMAAVVGVGVGVVTYFAKRSYPEAVLAGLFTAGACTAGLHNLIG